MALREKFGRLVLLEETDADAVGREYHAARLGPAGFDRLVTLLRLSPAVSANAEAAKRLMDQARLVARLQNPGLVRVLGIGRVEQAYYISSELVEGRTLQTIEDRCRREAFPLAADHALMVASRAASGLEYLHGKKDEAGGALFHGLLAPSRLVVAFDGEVKVKGLGLWPGLRGTDILGPDQRRYLAPEQTAGGAGDARSDVYALGLVLLEALADRPLEGGDPLANLPVIRVAGPRGEPGPLPPPLVDALRRALAPDPAARFPGMAEMRKAIDTLLFSGDFTPTTFDLAFFMNTLFRDDMDREAQALEEARRADYREFIVDEKPPAPAAVTAVSSPTASEVAPAAEPAFAPASPASSDPGRTALPAREGASKAREAAARLTFHREPDRGESRRWLWLLGGLLAAAVLGGGAGYVYFVRSRAAGPAMTPAVTPSPATGPEEAAALARVRELEGRIATLEREKAEAETRAAEEARKKVEVQAKARGQAVDPAAVERAQEEARRRERGDQELRQREERLRLEAEKKAEEQRAAAEPTPAPTPVPTPPPAQAATPTPTPVPTLTPTPTPPPAQVPPATPTAMPTPEPNPPATKVPVRPGVLVASDDPGVVLPVLLRESPTAYPHVALDRRVEAGVTVRALVDEKGHVAEATVVEPSGQPAVYGFEDAALKRARGRLYRPATKDGVPVRIWLNLRVVFKLPKP